jgi:hypothetical protein
MRRVLNTPQQNSKRLINLPALVSGYLGFTRDVGDRLKDVLDVDPDMPMAVIVKGYFFLLFANGPMAVRAGKALKQVEEIAEKQPLNDREKGHLKALSCWCIGDHRGMTCSLGRDSDSLPT